MADALKHPTLGEVRGNVHGDVTQYLGIPFATLKDRFALPEVIKTNQDGLDATKMGPTPISPPQACGLEQSLIQQTLPWEPNAISDLHGLNLNLTLPTEKSTNLPVFVFIFGGGFAIGSNSYPQYDGKVFVQHSIKIDKPVIVANINYRLGVPGFLTSSELTSHGYPPNRGLHDQRAALLWIREHIAGFGGDPTKITVGGESAGSASTLYMLASPPLEQGQPLLHRAIPMSGNPIAIKAAPPAIAEIFYQNALKALKIDHLSPEERIKALLTCRAEDFFEALPPDLQCGPTLDDDLIKVVPTHDLVTQDGESVFPGFKTLEGLMLGDTKDDGSIFAFFMGSRIPGFAKTTCELATKFFATHPSSTGPDAAKVFLDAYKITPETPDAEAFANYLTFTSHITFHIPTLTLSRSYASLNPYGKLYTYAFNEPNPWEGPAKGQATHILDVSFLFLNFQSHLPTHQRPVAEQFATDVITFINGEEPYPPTFATQSSSDGSIHVGIERGVQVYGSPSGETKFVKSEKLEDVGRDSLLLDVAEKVGGLDVLDGLWSAVLRGSV